MTEPLTLFEKIWRRHALAEDDGGQTLLYVDRTYLDETCFVSFEALEAQQRKVRRPDLTFVFADHVAPTRARRAGIPDPEAREAVERLEASIGETGITYLGLADPRQGIMHVVAPELGLTLPGSVIAADDSHTTTHGAFGALGLGIGLSECTHVLATQTLWQPRARTMRITLTGRLPPGVGAKDVILAVIGRIGVGGAIGHVVEFAGPVVEAMSMEARMTLSNMSVEAGARAGLIAPDATTFAYLENRPYAPTGEEWRRALLDWASLRSDSGARFDREVEIAVDDLQPMVSWGTSPQDVVPADGVVPDPATEADPARRRRMEAALDYMALVPGTPIAQIAIDRVFIGSCTNGRLEDLRAAAAVARGRRAVVPTMVVPGSSTVKRAAEAEGLDVVFRAAGFEWLEAGCSMCLGMNGDRLAHGERCASTTNRNFVGRQGPGGRTHLVSPAMAAAAAVTGVLADFRELVPVRQVPARPHVQRAAR